MQPASISSGCLGACLTFHGVWSAVISLRTKGREVLQFTDISKCFRADKGCYASDFSDFQNIKMLSFHCSLSDDRCPAADLGRPFCFHGHMMIVTNSQMGIRRQPGMSSAGCGSCVTGRLEKCLALWQGWRVLG